MKKTGSCKNQCAGSSDFYSTYETVVWKRNLILGKAKCVF